MTLPRGDNVGTNFYTKKMIRVHPQGKGQRYLLAPENEFSYFLMTSNIMKLKHKQE